MSRNKYKSNRAPYIKPTAQFASSYSAAREDKERFNHSQKKGLKRRIKKLDKGEH